MKKSFLEETVLFVSVIKWTVLSAIVGIVVGFSTAIFLKLLGWSSSAVQSHKYYFVFLPLMLFVSSLMVKYLAPDAEGSGTERIIEAVHKRWGKISLITVPVKMAATIITLAGGGSAGKEGPCAQIGAGLASGIADALKLNKGDRRKLVICGVSAGFATVFGTPVAGALFAVEVLVLGKILHEALFPSLVSAVVGYQITKSLGIAYFHQTIILSGELSGISFLQAMVSGIFFGLTALLLIKSLQTGEKLSRKLKLGKPLKALIGGGMLILLAFLLSPMYLGLGINTIEGSVNGHSAPLFAFVGKILFTTVTLSMGGNGGIVTPVFFIGTTAGSAYAQLLGMNTGAFAAIGMAAVLSGAANTPIAASVLAIEMFGPEIGPYAIIACVVSYIASGHRSIYSSQILATAKNTSISLPLMKDFKSMEEPRTADKAGKILHLDRKISSKDTDRENLDD